MISDSDRLRISTMFSAIHNACDMSDWRGFCNCVLGGDAPPHPLRKLKAFARLAQLVAPQQCDRLACRNLSDDEDLFECSECGQKMPTWDGDSDWIPVCYCPVCGCEVVGE